MSSLNKASLIGYLGRAPELRYVGSGYSVVSFPLATGEAFRDKMGHSQKRTVWHNIVIWGKLAEVANQYLKKGSQVYLEGRIDNRSYDDKEGNKRYVSEVVVDSNGKMVMLGSRGENKPSNEPIINQPKSLSAPDQKAKNTTTEDQPKKYDGLDFGADEDEDLPF